MGDETRQEMNQRIYEGLNGWDALSADSKKALLELIKMDIEQNKNDIAYTNNDEMTKLKSRELDLKEKEIRDKEKELIVHGVLEGIGDVIKVGAIGGGLWEFANLLINEQTGTVNKTLLGIAMKPPVGLKI